MNNNNITPAIFAIKPYFMRSTFLFCSILFSTIVFAQRNTSFHHTVSADAIGIAQGIGNLQYEYFDAPKRGITFHAMFNFTEPNIPVSGVLSRRFYFREENWSAFMAPYASYMFHKGTYIPDITDEFGNPAKGDESTYKSRSTNLGLSIGYSYVSFGGFSAAVEFGYGFPVSLNIDWAAEPAQGAEDALRAIAPLLLNLSIGYAF